MSLTMIQVLPNIYQIAYEALEDIVFQHGNEDVQLFLEGKEDTAIEEVVRALNQNICLDTDREIYAFSYVESMFELAKQEHLLQESSDDEIVCEILMHFDLLWMRCLLNAFSRQVIQNAAHQLVLQQHPVTIRVSGEGSRTTLDHLYANLDFNFPLFHNNYNNEQFRVLETKGAHKVFECVFQGVWLGDQNECKRLFTNTDLLWENTLVESPSVQVWF